MRTSWNGYGPLADFLTTSSWDRVAAATDPPGHLDEDAGSNEPLPASGVALFARSPRPGTIRQRAAPASTRRA